MNHIEGSIFYRERIMLPPDAEVSIFLEDNAKMDIAAEVVAKSSFTPQGGPPWNFSLEYDPAKLQDNGRYGLLVRIEVEGKLLFINTSHIPAFGQGSGVPVEIMVSRVGSGKTRDTGQAGRADASLTNTYWKLVEINKKEASLGGGKKELHLVLSSESARVRGFSGCNQFSGSYELGDDKTLQFGPLAATMMACMEGMEQEQHFLRALESVRHFSISGESLSLHDSEALVLLRFQSVYLQ
ncbi:MAG: META domain-containing protein [Thermodesulfobacteriota bacterium]